MAHLPTKNANPSAKYVEITYVWKITHVSKQRKF